MLIIVTVTFGYIPVIIMEFLPIFSTRKCAKSSVISHSFVHRRGLSLRNPLRTLRHKQDLNRRKYDLKILNDTRMSYIHQIHLQFVIRRSIVLSINLCITCQACFGLQAQCKFPATPFHTPWRFPAAPDAGQQWTYHQIKYI